MVGKTTISQQQQHQKRHQEDIIDKDDDQEANSSASLATRESFSNDDGASENGASLKTKKLVNRQRDSLFYGHNDLSDSESVSVAASKPPPQSLDYYDDVKKNLNFDDEDDEDEDTDDEDIENNESHVPNSKKTVNFVIDLRSQTSKITNKPTTNPNKQQSASKSTTPQQDHNLSTSSRATSMISLSTVTSASSMSLLRPNTSRITTKPNSTAGRKKWK